MDWLEQRFKKDYEILLKQHQNPPFSLWFPFDSDAWPTDESWRYLQEIEYSPQVFDDTKMWDQGINLKLNILQNGDLNSKIIAKRGINTDIADIRKSLATIGRIGGKLYRPRNNPYIVDLCCESHGWKLRKLAHALAHLSVDLSGEHPNDYFRQRLLKYYDLKLFAEACFCYRTCLPFDIRPRSKYLKRPGISQYGIDVYATTNEHYAKLEIPILGCDTLTTDKSLVQILASIHVEPIPASFKSWRAYSRWSCSPSIVSFRGFSLTDYSINNKIVQDWQKNLYWGIHEDDLWGFSEFGNVLYHLFEKFGTPRYDKNCVNLRTWINSSAYEELVLKAPLLSCCLHRNRNDKRSELLNYPKFDAEPDVVKEYRKNVKKIKWVINQSISLNDSKSGTPISRQRENRKNAIVNYNKARKIAKKKEKIILLRTKEQKGMNITDAEAEFIRNNAHLLKEYKCQK